MGRVGVPEAVVSSPATSGEAAGRNRDNGLASLAVGSLGVVFGEIGTSPLYVMRQALAHSRGPGGELAVLGVVSLIVWALILVVTLKYVVVLMRADNKGEGGALALMALAHRVSPPKRSRTILLLGLIGAAMFYGDAVITSSISVVSALEGLRDAPGTLPGASGLVLPLSIAILVTLFAAQSRGTAGVARFFGPVTAAWLLVLAGLGVWHVADNPSILRALSPRYGVLFLAENGVVGFVILGAVFLAVTGAEALSAHMGHFGKRPIRFAWLVLALPGLVLCYLGQGALVLSRPVTRANPFFEMIPDLLYWPVLGLATAAAIIASQAVITGAATMTQQAVQLGLLPRIDIFRTSETRAGQMYAPAVNALLMAGMLLLLAVRHTSSDLASAYGVAVTAAMFVDTLLFYYVVRHLWKRPVWQAAAVTAPLAGLDLVFVGANLLKIPDGAWMPLLLAAAVVGVMLTWTRGSQVLAGKARRESVALVDLAGALKARPPHRVLGTAVFLTPNPEVAPAALLHNLKHNKVLHQKNIILTVKVAETPRVRDADRVRIEALDEDFKMVTITYGFMESPNVPKALGLCRQRGLKVDIMATSFFLGRRSVVPSGRSGMPLWQDRLFIFLMRNAADPSDFYKIPPGRVVEMGTQVTV
jgi:KUP system potassium uptake protein